MSTAGCPNNYELRLADGVTATDGRVEYCLDGQWLVLCRNEVDLVDITVMCRQLGIEPNSRYMCCLNQQL